MFRYLDCENSEAKSWLPSFAVWNSVQRFELFLIDQSDCPQAAVSRFFCLHTGWTDGKTNRFLNVKHSLGTQDNWITFKEENTRQWPFSDHYSPLEKPDVFTWHVDGFWHRWNFWDRSKKRFSQHEKWWSDGPFTRCITCLTTDLHDTIADESYQTFEQFPEIVHNLMRFWHYFHYSS